MTRVPICNFWYEPIPKIKGCISLQAQAIAQRWFYLEAEHFDDSDLLRIKVVCLMSII
jgi:hypothetical protein